MDDVTVNGLFEDLAAGRWGPGVRVDREPMRVWEMSGVERLHPPQGGTVIFKYAQAPFHGEARVLAHAARHGVSVPQLLDAAERPGMLGMLLEDLGPALREPTLAEAAAAAVAIHRVPGLPGLPVLDATGLAELPGRALVHLEALVGASRWRDTDDIAAGLCTLKKEAAVRAAGAELPPFGLCHSEFHPTSLHVGTDGWRLLDWARAFVGPGLLDLMSWQGTLDTPDVQALTDLLHAYTAAGGPADVWADRGGLAAAHWAILWHRVWIIEWFLAQSTTWLNDPGMDELYQQVIRRHLAEALQCLP
jgi:Phosphotransferase enzyme family